MKEEKRLLYITIDKGKRAKRKWWDSYEQSFFLCKSRRKAGFELIHCPVPEFVYKEKAWEAEKLRKLLEQVIANVQPDDYLLHPHVRKALSLSEELQEEPPAYILHAMLFRCRNKESISISLPDEGGMDAYDIIINLLTPYLPKVNAIYLVGGEEWLVEDLEDYFYFEYGIVAQTERKPKKNSFYLNLWSKNNSNTQAEDEGNAITYGTTLKFLDTMVKNGYNTES